MSFADENRIVQVKVEPSTGCKTTATVFGCVRDMSCLFGRAIIEDRVRLRGITRSSRRRRSSDARRCSNIPESSGARRSLTARRVCARHPRTPGGHRGDRSLLRATLPAINLSHTIESFAASPPWAALGPRQDGLLIASRFPMTAATHAHGVVWPERLLSARVALPGQDVTVHTTHIPPGSSNKGMKVEMLEAVMAVVPDLPAPSLLCGDFNATGGDTRGADRDVGRMDDRTLHGYGREDFSWYLRWHDGWHSSYGTAGLRSASGRPAGLPRYLHAS
jgi:Endonuclease/Exonuclease/phosphatase family